MFSICTKIRHSNGSLEDIAVHLEEMKQRYAQFGDRGLRVIAVCYKEISIITISKEQETEMVFAGYITLQDPVKEGIRETIQSLEQLHVSLKIISGDNKNVAKSIAIELGITNPIVLTGGEIFHMSAEALQLLVRQTHIFAEVEPQQKERIILALRKFHTVAYLGDGINDVSAIKAADIGISVENAVDITRESADFVLMEKNIMVIVDGIIEGRKTFVNTLKYIYINTGSTFGNMFSVAFASLLLPFLPMLPKQILLTNFITDFPYISVASDNVDKEQLEKPGKWDLKSVRVFMLIFGIHSSVFDVITFFTLYYLLKVKASSFQTAWFVESILTELVILFIIRTHHLFFKSKPGGYLFILSVAAFIVTVGLPYMPFASSLGLSPLPLLNMGMIFLIVFSYLVTGDLLKKWFFKRYKN